MDVLYGCIKQLLKVKRFRKCKRPIKIREKKVPNKHSYFLLQAYNSTIADNAVISTTRTCVFEKRSRWSSVSPDYRKSLSVYYCTSISYIIFYFSKLYARRKLIEKTYTPCDGVLFYFSKELIISKR